MAQHLFKTLAEVKAEWEHCSQLYELMCMPFDEHDNTERQEEMREYLQDLETIMEEWK